MLKKLVLTLVLIAMTLTPAAIAQDAEPPTVAYLRFGPVLALSTVEDAILGILIAHDFLTFEEGMAARAGSSVMGESLNFVQADANFNMADVNLIVESALDHEPAVLLTASPQVTLNAINATAEMDDPPAIIFTAVVNPYATGIAVSSCEKPDHVIGTVNSLTLKEVVGMVPVQNPDVETIGIVYTADQASSRWTAEELSALATELGLMAEVAAVNSIPDIALAVDGLLEKGAQALVLPADFMIMEALPIIMVAAVENSIPVFSTTLGGPLQGTTFGAEAADNMNNGRVTGHMLAQYLKGNLNTASTGIQNNAGVTVGINLDTAEMQGIEVAKSLQDRAGVIVADGASSGSAYLKHLMNMGAPTEMVMTVLQEVAAASVEGEQMDLSETLMTVGIELERAPSVQAKLQSIVDGMSCAEA